MTVLLEIRDLVKHYPGAKALNGVDLVVEQGQVHCLLGQNGAGKSTLIKCISGSVEPTSGKILLNGEALPSGNPKAVLKLGVATMYQELDLVNDLTVAENIFLGNEKRIGPFLDRRSMKNDAKALLSRLGHANIDPNELVGTLRPAEKQLVSMARALSRNVKLLIMDEPSAVLDPPEVDALFEVVERLTAENVGVIYISHRMDEIARIGDKITVLRDGSTVATDLAADTPVDELIPMLVGRSLSEVFPDRVARRDDVVLSVKDFTLAPHVFDASFEVRAGEIVGIGGLVGAGRTELLRGIFGLEVPQKGTVHVGDRRVRAGHPDDSIGAGLALAPEERKSQGLWLAWSQIRNVSVTDLAKFRKGPFLSKGEESDEASKHLRSLNVRPDDPSMLVSQLSGGNQQKVVLARWLLHHSKVLLLDEPTRGVDVGARADVYRVIGDLAAAGLGIVMVSSELGELVGFCDRVLVMRDGRLVADLDGPSSTEEDVLRHAVRTGEGAA